MKKYIPHILIGLIAISVIMLFVTGRSKGPRLNERISFKKTDKIPYGTYVAYQNLQYIFPKSSISSDKQQPGFWDSLSNYDDNQALIIVSPSFNADETEMKKLLRFIENGNDVFVSTMRVSFDAEKFIKSDIFYPAFNDFTSDEQFPDSLKLSLDEQENEYSYPGKSLDFWFNSFDSSTSTILGRNRDARPNFIHMRAGAGNFYLHLAPMAFTNYFLLHKNNLDYYEHALSTISVKREKIVWDEYYLNKPNNSNSDQKRPNWLSVLMNMQNGEGRKPFKTAIWLAIGLLIAYVLFEMRRKQRIIPVMTKPRNDSMDFVKTIGRLYHDKGDHRNLSRKMAAYFLEHIRTRYKLPTNKLDDAFIASLHFKTGIAEMELRPIIEFISSLDTRPGLTERQLADFHKQLESFYKTA